MRYDTAVIIQEARELRRRHQRASAYLCKKRMKRRIKKLMGK